MQYKDYDTGQRLSHTWVNEVNRGIKRLRNIRGAGGVTVSHSEGGIVVRGSKSLGTQTIIGKAKREAGAYPTLQDWSEGDQPTVWDFQRGDISYGESGYNPTLTFDAGDEPKYVRAFNLAGGNTSVGHYIPENRLVALHEIDGQWYCEEALPDVITVTLEDRFVAGSYLDCSTSLGDQRIYDYFLPSDYSLPVPSGFGVFSYLGVAALQLYSDGFSTQWRYILIEANVCQEPIPEE